MTIISLLNDPTFITSGTISRTHRGVDDCTIGQIAMDGDLIAFSGLDFSAIKYDDKQSVKNTVFLYSIVNRTQQALCKQPNYQIEPAIGEGYVAWRTTGEGYRDTITIYSLADHSQFTLSPPDGASYAHPSVGGGRLVASLYYKDPKTSGPYKVEIVATALPGMETTTLSLPETPHRSAPQSDGECIFWPERYTDTSSRVMVYDIKSGTIIGTFALSGVKMDIDNNHLISIDIGELRGVSSLWLTTFTGEEQPSPGETTADGRAGILPDASMIGFGVIAVGIVSTAVLRKRGSK